MKKIIVTGFKPFGAYAYNPTEKTAKAVNGIVIDDRIVIGVVLPSTYRSAFKQLEEIILREKPYAVISTGLASSVTGFCIESAFLNTMAHAYADNDGFKPEGTPVIEDGPICLYSTASAIELFNVLTERNVPARISSEPGSFICNALAYQTIALIKANELTTKNTFVHLPWSQDYQDKVELEDGKIFLNTETIYRGMDVLIRKI